MLAWNRNVCDLIHIKYHLFCFFATTLTYYGILDMARQICKCMQSCSCEASSNHLHKIQVLLFCKIGYQSHFLSIYSPAYKTQSCMIYSNRLLTLHLKMATRRAFASRWTEKRYHCTFNCVYGYNKVVQCNYMLKSCGCTGKSTFNGFIPTMQFVEKQHNLTLKALILQTYARLLVPLSSGCYLKCQCLQWHRTSVFMVSSERL